MQKRARVEREEWAKRVERWRDSGLKAAEFAAELGINPRTLTVLGVDAQARGEQPEASLAQESAEAGGGSEGAPRRP